MADVVPFEPDPRDKVPVVPPGRAAAIPSAPPDSDADLFARAMADVVPIIHDARGRVRPIPTGAAPPPQRSPQADPDDDVPSAFVKPGVDRREIRKLKRGAYPVDDRIDLHGLTAASACAEVSRLLDKRRHPPQRCVCIVHGRGLHSDDGVSVLKTRVRELLMSHAAVLAFTDAPPFDGGSGAVYVLLRR